MCMPDVYGSRWHMVYTHCMHGVCVVCMYIRVVCTYVLCAPCAVCGWCVYSVLCAAGTLCENEQAGGSQLPRPCVVAPPLSSSLPRPLHVWGGGRLESDKAFCRGSCAEQSLVDSTKSAILQQQSPRPVLSPEVSAVGRVLLPSP